MFQIPSDNLKGLKPIGLVHPESLVGKRVIVRCDFNVPLKKGKIINTLRIDKSLRTINYLRNSGAQVVLMSHIGRDKSATLKPVYKYLKKKFDIKFVDEVYTYVCTNIISEMKDGDVVLFENLRRWRGEEQKDPSFTKLLSSFGDIFVNEAFSASHRDYSSITGIPIHLSSYIGFQFKDEVENLSKVFDLEHPSLILIGGAKFKTKIASIEFLKDKADSVFIGGALANDIYVAQSIEVGSSIVSNLEKDIILKLLNSKKIILPVDVKTVNKYGMVLIKKLKNIKAADKIVDGGPKTFKELRNKIKESKSIIWNGPFGLYEKGYDYLTKKVAKELAKSKAFVVVGGGDTLSAISCRGRESYDFISMAGGAMLEFISKRTLPGIDAIKRR